MLMRLNLDSGADVPLYLNPAAVVAVTGRNRPTLPDNPTEDERTRYEALAAARPVASIHVTHHGTFTVPGYANDIAAMIAKADAEISSANGYNRATGTAVAFDHRFNPNDDNPGATVPASPSPAPSGGSAPDLNQQFDMIQAHGMTPTQAAARVN